MEIAELRKYRIQLEQLPFFNDKSEGIALFDLILSFVGAFLLDKLFNLSKYLPCNNKRVVYYLLVIPFGIIVHHIVAHIQSNFSVLFPQEITFLNKHLFNKEFNVYKVLVLINLILIFIFCKYKNVNLQL